MGGSAEGLSPMAIKVHHSIAVHPGVWLRAGIVDAAGLSVTALAARLRVTRQAASNLLNGNAGCRRKRRSDSKRRLA